MTAILDHFAIATPALTDGWDLTKGRGGQAASSAFVFPPEPGDR